MEVSLVGFEVLIIIIGTHVAGHKAVIVGDPQQFSPDHDSGLFIGYAIVIKTLHPTNYRLSPMVTQRRENYANHTTAIPTKGQKLVIDQHKKPMEKLPSEIWIATAECLPRNALLQLVAVNRFFYEIGMDILYAEVELCLTNSVVKASFGYIGQPLIAKRIRHLKLSIEYFHWSSPEHARTPEQKSLPISEEQWDEDDASSKSPDFFDFTEAMGIFLQALPNMRHIRTLSLHTTQSTVLPGFFSFDAVLSAIWNTCSSTLQRFSYQGTLPNLTSILRSSPPPKIELGIEVLGSLRFPSGGNVGDASLPEISSNNQATSVDALVSQFRQVSSQLRSLHLVSLPTEDLSPLYSKLKDFSTLRLAGLGLRSSASTLSDPAALTGFLTRVSPELKQFMVYYPGSWPVQIFEHAETTWNNCLLQCLARPECFANLRVLKVYPTMLDSGLDALLAFIRNSEAHLEEIAIEQRYWSICEIKKLVHGLKACKSLRTLKFSSLQYDSSLIDCLAQNLPNLWSLYLNIDGLSGGLQTRRYDLWKLYDLTICRKGSMSADELMLELAQQIPSVTSFFGSGSMDLGEFY